MSIKLTQILQLSTPNHAQQVDSKWKMEEASQKKCPQRKQTIPSPPELQSEVSRIREYHDKLDAKAFTIFLRT